MRRILLVLLVLLVGLPGVHAANWTIAGDAVFWEGTFGKITVWPHTGTGLTYQEQYANVTWNLAANTLDFAFVFDYPIKGNLYLWANITETRQTPILNTIEQTFSCSAPSTHSYTNEVYTCIYANGTTAWTQYYTWKAGDDLAVKVNITYANFTSSSVTVLGWKDITGQVTHQVHGGKDYYLITNVAMAQGQTRSVRWSYTTPFNSTGKWSLMAKLSSDSIATAYSTNRYLILDPWWNTTYIYSRIINVTNLDASLVLQRNHTANLTFNHSGLVADGKSNVSGLDVRVVYQDATELDRVNVTAWNTSATTIIFKLQANISAGSADITNYKLYYGNLGANNPPASRAAVIPSAPNLTNVSFLFDFIKGTNFTRLEDVSGQGNNATIVNGNWTPGKYGWALDFNGTTGYAVMPMTQGLNRTINGTAWSINVGYCPSSTSVTSHLIDLSVTAGRGFDIFMNATGHVLLVWRGPPGQTRVSSTGGITAGSCYDIWGTWNGTNQSLYVNGVFNASLPNANISLGHGENIFLGAVDTSSNPANGSFYKAALYNRSVSGPEIAALYIGTEPKLSLLAETTFPTSFDFNITVYRGWNLLTMWKNYTLLELTNLTTAPANITVAQCWNSVNQSWTKYNWTNSSGNSSYICEKGLAAFILIGRDDTLNFTNISFDTGATGDPRNWTVNVSLYVGYNYVGIPGNVSLLNASNWTSSFRFVSCWNASKQEYYTYLNRSIWVGGLHNTSVCKEGTGVVLYSLVNETIEMKREFDATPLYVAAIVLFLTGAGAWIKRWRSRSGET